MRIAVDARSLNRPHLRGIGKVLTKIIEYSTSEFQWLLIGDRPDLDFHTPEHPNLEYICVDQLGFRLNTWEQYRLPKIVKENKPDLVLCPGNSAPLVQSAPVVGIIHDTVPWQRNIKQEPSRGKVRTFLDKRSFQKCKAIATISKSSANAITQRWPSLADKLTIIPNGVDANYFAEQHSVLSQDLTDRGIEEPFFIYYGGNIPRKRPQWAIDAFEAASLDQAKLVLCGINESELESFELPADLREKLITPGYIPESEMPCLLQRATAVLYPTLYEGFGLPAIESQASGTACLLSPVSSLAELIGPGTITLPTKDKEKWTDAIKRIHHEGGLNQDVATAARKWAEEYTWVDCASKYHQVFRDICTLKTR